MKGVSHQKLFHSIESWNIYYLEKKWDLKDEDKSWARTDQTQTEVQCPNETGPKWLYLGDPSDNKPNDPAGDGIKVECGKLSNRSW